MFIARETHTKPAQFGRAELDVACIHSTPFPPVRTAMKREAFGSYKTLHR